MTRSSKGRRPTNRAGLAALCLGAALGSVLAACGSSSSGSGDALKVGVVVDLTGYAAGLDAGVREGIELRSEQLRDDGSGPDYELEVEDMKGDPQTGFLAAQRLISQDGVAAILTGFVSSMNAAISPILSGPKVPSVVASVVESDADWQFTTIPLTDYDAESRVGFLKSIEGVSEVAIVHDNTPFAQATLEKLEPALEKAGIGVTKVATHASDVVDMRPQVQSLLRDQPDAILKLSSGASTVVAAKAMAESGTDIPLVLAEGALTVQKQASDAYDESYFLATPPQIVDALPEDQRSSELSDFASVIAGEDDFDPAYLARGWDAMGILDAAVEKAGGVDADGDAIRETLSTLKYTGVTGTYQFSDDDHFGLVDNPFYVARYDGDSPTVAYAPTNS